MQRDSLRVWVVMVAAVVVVGLAYPRAPGELRSLPDRETRLPGGTAVIYPTADAARAACGAAPLGFVDQDQRVYFRAGEPRFGVWGGRQLPAHGFGCVPDLEDDGYRPA